ncbi:WecB/TagA/CpsF family glycosyltransferase [Rhodococcus sp. USK10]|uniref:WecB/TagA/CpsF family glycosyltransferase n=1 Tax=Rhodococcus sp. USK10 TaxID=2789739 RepID=UPI001C6012E7|nr:WecB/TagA/CpsF family glycosyltransferase [Rhodococcus sp. USK10]QYB08110.1 WecB/TagA/CpsF family glycosyltransferase [Rhodococcus sp. USK10]
MATSTQNPEVHPTCLIGEIPFAATTLRSATEFVINLGLQSISIPVFLSNAYCVAHASKDPEYAALFSGRGIAFPDGLPIVWFMRGRMRGMIRPMRVRGPSLFVSTLDRGREDELRHFFLGTTEDTLLQLTEEVRRRYPGAKISGFYSPPFGPLDHEFYRAAEDAIRKTDSQIVWVALGTPKQDFAAARLSSMVGQPCVAVGAAFDFVAGTSREAPLIVQRSGFEWLYRFMKEPRRLWRRYVFGNLTFLRVAALGGFQLRG